MAGTTATPAKRRPEPVAWSRPAAGTREVAEGFVLADTASRFAAYAIDNLILFVVDAAILIYVAPVAVSVPGPDVASPPQIVGRIATLAVEALYFIGSWTGGRRATVGQRLVRIEVGKAWDGQPLTASQASRRWLAFGSWINVASLFRPAAVFASGALAIWTLALLWTTSNSPTKQGFHDRFANTAVVRKEGGTRSVWLVLFAILAWVIVTLAWTGSLTFRG